MQSKNINYMPALDHLRFFAAMMIVVFHLANGKLVHYLHLDIGVNLFFTLSGYLFFSIAYNHKNQEISYWKFIYNRVLRIYPLVTFLFLIAVVVVDNFTALDFVNLFGLNFPGKARDSWIVGDWGYQYLSFNWWTIGVEFTFYLLFPILFAMYRKHGIVLLFKLLFLVILLKYFLYYSLLEAQGWKKLAICFNYSFFTNFDIFIIGMLFSYWEKKDTKNKLISLILKSKIFLIFYIGLMFFILANFSDIFPIPLSNAFCATLCSMLIVFYQRCFSSNVQEGFISKTLSSLGQISFSIYLLHDFIKAGLRGLGVEEWFVETFFITITQDPEIIKFCLLGVYIPIILLISRLSFNTIEYPFLNMRVKYFVKKDMD